MKKNLFSLVFILFCTTSFGQSPKEKMLFVIDSIPLLNDPEEWNPILQEDISDIQVVRGKDTLARLGYEKLDGITYVFTKEYRNRPDSLKQIPGLKQMTLINDAWNLHNNPYSGKYFDYYNSGKIQDEGTLLNGKLNGQLVVYFKNGTRKSVSNYENGVLQGAWNDYYTNGTLMQTREFIAGKEMRTGKIFFITEQIQHELKFKKDTPYDTAFTYFSSGKVKEMKLIRNGEVIPSKKDETVNYYTPKFYKSINTGDTKEANRSFFKIWEADSTNIDTYFKEGLLLLKELHFDEAIADFDKALKIEPLMRESLVHRALARIKKYQLLNEKEFLKDDNKALTPANIASIPADEQNKICADLQQAEYVDFSDVYVKKIIPALMLNHCREKSTR